MKKGDENKALEYFKKAVSLEEDNFKRADILYNIAVLMKNKGRNSEARSYANQALESRPSLGRAYLLIAQMYAQSASACGNGDVFAVRMVYQAALEKAYKAKAVDPSISTTANKFISSYGSKAPTTEDVFIKGIVSGSSWRIGCWIGESVRVP
jgi:tetratricopeptide (TPR) repeat protein